MADVGLLALAKEYANWLFGKQADYVVEHGVQSGWIYEKWASGVAKCYSSISKDANTTIYDSTACDAKVAYASLAKSFPSGLFKDKPYVFVTAVDSGTGNVTAEDFSSTATICYVTVWGTRTAIGTVNVEAVGFWK